MSSRSKDFIFQEDQHGELKFIGDFEGFYQSEDDPWQQSALDSDMSNYYQYSRENISNYINKEKFSRILEIGCGIGHSTAQLAKKSKADWCGADISQTAIDKAAINYPDLNFFRMDVCDISNDFANLSNMKFDCIILNQVLWYIMHAMPEVKRNLLKQLTCNGHVIFSTAFLNEQRYGNEYFQGSSGFNHYIEQHWSDFFDLYFQQYDSSDTYNYHDGLLCLKRNRRVYEPFE
jgi:SAM-dependent methyltransferase